MSFIKGNMSTKAFLRFWKNSETAPIKSAMRFPNSTNFSSLATSSSRITLRLSIPPCFMACHIGENAFSTTRAPSMSGLIESTILPQPSVKESHQLAILFHMPSAFGNHFWTISTVQLLTLSTVETRPSINAPVPKAETATIIRFISRVRIRNIFCIATFAGSRNVVPKSANWPRTRLKNVFICPISVWFTASNCPATPPSFASSPDIISFFSSSFVFTLASLRAFSISGPSSFAAVLTSLRLFFESVRAAIIAPTFSAAAPGSWPADPKSISDLNIVVLAFICGVFIVLDIAA